MTRSVPPRLPTQGGGGPGFTPLGKIVSILLILGLFAAGIFVFLKTRKSGRETAKQPPTAGDTRTADARTGGDKGDAGGKQAEAPEGLVETQTAVPRLDPPGTYEPKDNVVDVELSEYAGYAGLIAANGGLEPNDNSVFAKRHGFKVRIKLSEEESWSALNAGKMAASATTVDVLAVYGRQFQVTVPVQIGFSRGADGVVVRSDVKRINGLKGKTLVTAQFTETDFLIRYLAQEAGLGINMLPGLDAAPNPEALNLLFAEDGFTSGDVFLSDLQSGKGSMAGCVTWAPKTTEVVEKSGGKATLLATNRNLLIVADILVVNRGFAKANPKMVAGLVDGLLEGNRMVRDNANAHLDVIGRAFKWDRAQTQAELAKVHLSNLPENLEFFQGEISAAGSFEGIFQSAIYAYGSELVPNPAPAEPFMDLQPLKDLQASGAYKDQKVSIAPIRSGNTVAIEDNPLLSKDIRFFFMPNSTQLDMDNPANQDNLTSIRDLLKVSPGSTVVIVGHVDNFNVPEFKRRGILREMSLQAVQMSKDRAEEVRKRLLERHKEVDPSRLTVIGRGWDEPAGTDSEKNRRVEVQWFLIE